MGLEESHFPLAKPRAFSVLSSPLDSMQWSKSQLTQNKDELFSLDNCEVSCSVAPDSLQPRGLQPTRLLCPWDLPVSAGVGCHCLLQVIFPTQGMNPCSLHCPGGFFTTESPGKFKMIDNFPNTIFIQLLGNFWTTL